ncbi:MAG: hypothetical protein MZV70_50440 [Desulfobacterales bacterium]|nr:hypothetical protein [Desulfobacterales bacterium]
MKKIHVVLVHLGPGAVRRFQHQPDREGRGVHARRKPARHRSVAHRLRPQGPELVPQEQAPIAGRAHRHHGDRRQVHMKLPSAGRKLVQGFLDGGVRRGVRDLRRVPQHRAGRCPMLKKLLPIPPIEKAEAERQRQAGYLPEHICEPSAAELLGEMLPRNVYRPDLQRAAGDIGRASTPPAWWPWTTPPRPATT